MSYKRGTIWEKQLPAFMGVFVLLFTLGLTLFLSGDALQFVTRATVDSVPKNIQVTNISKTSFTISYVTDASAIGTVAYGKDTSLGSIGLDFRDLQGNAPSEHRVHFITIQDLKPGTKYYYAITSGAQVITNNGTPFEITTAPDTTAQSSSNGTISGSVALDDGTFPVEGIVYISTDTSQLLASLLQPDGTFVVSLSQLRTIDLTTFLSLEKGSEIKVQVHNGTLQSDAKVLHEQARDVPAIILSKNYDFTISPDPLASPIASGSAPIASEAADFPIFDEPVVVTSPEITTPEVDQQFKDPQPVFKGKALPSTQIEIVINSEKEILATLVSDSNGYWEFRPPLALDPGDHVITIASVDVNGTLQKLSRSFTVNAAGSQFVEPSVSPTELSPTQASIITPTLPQVPTPTFTPTPIASATAIPSPTSTITPPVLTTTITPTRGPLTPTGSYSSLAGIAMSVLFLAGGVILFFVIAV